MYARCLKHSKGVRNKHDIFLGADYVDSLEKYHNKKKTLSYRTLLILTIRWTKLNLKTLIIRPKERTCFRKKNSCVYKLRSVTSKLSSRKKSHINNYKGFDIVQSRGRGRRTPLPSSSRIVSTLVLNKKKIETQVQV